MKKYVTMPITLCKPSIFPWVGFVPRNRWTKANVGCKLPLVASENKITAMRKNKTLLFTLPFLTSIICFGQSGIDEKIDIKTEVIEDYPKPQSFKNLTTLRIIETRTWTRDNEPRISSDSILIHFDKSVTEVLKKQIVKGDPLYDEYIGDGEWLLIRTKLDKSKAETYVIGFSPGLSGDPVFGFLKENNGNLVNFSQIYGLQLFVPSDGNIFVTGHTNNMFDQRKKYRLTNDTIIEVKQPYYYVGLKSSTKKPIQLYREKAQKQIVAFLPEKSEIEVIINDGEYYLIKTSFGLVGWWKLDNMKSEEIEDLYFNGD